MSTKHRVFSVTLLALAASWFRTASGYDAPDDCEWQPLLDARRRSEVKLSCRLRTINSEYDKTNFSAIPAEHTASLEIRCSEALLHRSSLLNRSLSHLVNLREIQIDFCRLDGIPSDAFYGCDNLRNLTIRSRNRDWSSRGLVVERGAFRNLRHLVRLDLSENNIWAFKESLFCNLNALSFVNVSHNRLQHVSDFNFNGSGKQAECSDLYVKYLDASHNSLSTLVKGSFSSLKYLKKLHLEHNDVSMVEDDALQGLISLRYLDLSDNKIVALPAKTFHSNALLKELRLRNNSLSFLPPDLFHRLEHLLILDLSHNKLNTNCDACITKGTFDGLKRLFVLNLASNDISSVEGSLFSDLKNLQVLDLSDNHIAAIPPDTFASLSNLHNLRLSNNRIQSLGASSLNGAFFMNSLLLDNNTLLEVHPLAFKNCSVLSDLSLQDNLLDSVPSAIFGLTSLASLSLGGNLIESLQNGTFQQLPNLSSLSLISNKIQNISIGALKSLSNLKILNLANNRLQSIEKGTFDSNLRLQAIRVDSNRIRDIVGLFNNLPALAWLNVSYNEIEKFDYFLVPNSLEWLDMHRNGIEDLGNYFDLESELRITSLDVSFNKLTYISAKTIPDSVQLLFLNDNRISKIGSNTFVNKRNLTRVDLYANQIVNLEINALRIKTGGARPGPLPEFYLGGNPFTCDCKLDWLQSINDMDHLHQYPVIKDLESIYCKLVYSRDDAYVPLVEADTSQFLCTYNTHCFTLCECCDFDACDCEMTCPDNCTCFNDQSWSSNIVECSSSGFDEPPTKIPMDATEVYLDGNTFRKLSSHSFIGRKNMVVLHLNNSNVEEILNHTFSGLGKLTQLYLQDNKITYLKGFEFSGLDNLKELFLQNNLISYINNFTFSRLASLEILQLHGNALVQFPAWTLHSNSYLVEVTLSGNRWSCECNFVLRFHQWLSESSKKVSDSEKVNCIRNATGAVGLYLANEESSDCVRSSSSVVTVVERKMIQDYLPLLIVTFSVFVVFIAVVCVLFYHRHDIRVWVYSRCGLRMCYKDALIEYDRDRLYDAYVAYSSKDENFVTQVFAPELEHGEPNYKICLHHRDFPVGPYVSDTIVEAVECSRRTVLILSKNFLLNEWTRYDIKSALHQILKDRRRKAVIILLGDIPARELDPDIRLYLKTNTCIHWNDRIFWQKLRFSLPDVRQRSDIRIPEVSVCQSIYETPHGSALECANKIYERAPGSQHKLYECPRKVINGHCYNSPDQWT